MGPVVELEEFFEPFFESLFCEVELMLLTDVVVLTAEPGTDENAESSAVAAFTVSAFFLEPKAMKLLLEAS